VSHSIKKAKSAISGVRIAASTSSRRRSGDVYDMQVRLLAEAQCRHLGIDPKHALSDPKAELARWAKRHNVVDPSCPLEAPAKCIYPCGCSSHDLVAA